MGVKGNVGLFPNIKYNTISSIADANNNPLSCMGYLGVLVCMVLHNHIRQPEVLYLFALRFISISCLL